MASITLSRNNVFTTLYNIILLCLYCQFAWSNQNVIYVKNSTSCQHSDHDENCHTLKWYTTNSSFTSNTEILFEEGIHTLDDFIELSHCQNFTMAGNGSAIHDGIPQPTSTIICNNTANNGFLFSNSSDILIQNLKLSHCSGLFNLENSTFACSLVFISVYGVSLSQVVISNAKGCGLYMYNIYGSNEISDSAFLNTSQPVSTITSGSGNAKIFFDNKYLNSQTNLVVKASWFMYGKTSRETTATGGLNVFIYRSSVRVNICNVTIQGNDGENGGNMAIFIVAFVVNTSNVVIDKSHIIDGRATKGGGLRIWSRQNYHQEKCNSSLIHILNISNTIFQGNEVKKTGGALYMAYYSNSSSPSHCDSASWHVTVSHCNFSNNGGNGAAMEITQHSVSHHHMFKTSIDNSFFTNNFMPSSVDGPIIHFKSVEVSMKNCKITGSNTTVISLRNTYLHLYDNIVFENNIARIGGALKVCEASLVFAHIDAHICFVNNSAEKGGAIYVQQPCMDTSPVCFIQPAVPEIMPVIEFTERIKFVFVNNSARIAGDALYGGNLDLCTTIVPYYWNTSKYQKYYWHSSRIFQKILNTTEQRGPSWISSNPRRVCFCTQSQQTNNRSCIMRRDPIQVHPGETFTVSVVTVGQLNGSTSGIINSALVDGHQNHTLTQLNHPDSSSHCVNLTYVLKSNQSSAHIHFKPMTTEIASRYKRETLNLTVQLLPCPVGFQLTSRHPYQCICNKILTDLLLPDSEATCNITSQSISVPQRRIWFGCYDAQNNNSSSSCKSLVATPNCDYYCLSKENANQAIVEVSLSDLDSQCLTGHTGIMCGACKEGYSRVLGGLLQCQKNCSNTNLSLILVYLASGIILIIIIRALNLTVTEGTLNGLLVYSMVIQTHRDYFSEDQSTFGKICWVWISWINLTLGIKSCFFKGMTAYQQVWTLYTHISYFLLIIAFIILLSRKFIFFTRLFGRNIVKILATVVFLLYSNLLYASFITFRYAILHIATPNGTRYSVAWYYDGNVPYFGLKHAPLFLIALLCSLVLLLYVFSLLLVQCLQRRSDLLCLRWVEKLRPFYEAYTGPCCDNYRFWPGFLLFMRSGLYIMNLLIPRAYNTLFFQLKMILTAAIFVIIMSLACIFPHGVYKKWPLNVLEFSFYLNLSITSLILGFNYSKQQNISVLYTSVSISALTFFGILLYHVYSQIKDTTPWKKLTTWCSLHTRSVCICRKQTEIEELNNSDKRRLSLLQTMPPVVKFDGTREPLLEA